MLEVLKKEEVSGVCVVVTRYFGGILLGAGGLARAYARGARDALHEAGICEFTKVFCVKAEIDYSLFSKVEFELNQRRFRIVGKEFGQGVILKMIAEPEERDRIAELLQELSGGKIVLVTEGETFAEKLETL